MPPLLLLAAQSATIVDPVAPPRLQVVKPCPPADPGAEIVVCGRPDTAERYRLRPLPERYAEPPARASTSISGPLTAAIETEQKMIAGAPSNRVMVRLRLPF